VQHFKFSVLTSVQRLGGRSAAIRQIAALGYDGIEFGAPTPDESVDAIVQELAEAQLEAVVIGTLENGGRTLLRPERSAQEVREIFLPPSRLAQASGANRMQYCCLEKLYPGDTLAGFRDRLIERLSIAADVAEAHGVVLCFEPLAPDSGVVAVSTPEGCAILEMVNKPALRMTFDTYHAAAAGEDPVESLQLAVPWLRHVHLSDIRHTPNGLQRPLPGKGEIDFGRFLQAVAESGYTGYVGMEGQFESQDVVGELAQCLAYLKGLRPL